MPTDTIIAHVRWFDAAGIKHDTARATIKKFIPIPPPEPWDYRPLVYTLTIALGVVIASVGSWVARRAWLQYKKAM